MNIHDILTIYWPNLVFYASILSAALPEPKPGSVGAAIKTIVNYAALAVGNAKPTPGNSAPPTIPPAALLAFFILLSGPAQILFADSLSWTLPTTRENGAPLNPATDLSAIKVYKTGGAAGTDAVYTLPYNAVSYTVQSDCITPSLGWAVTAVDKTAAPVGPLESPLSDIVTTTLDKVGCKPKKLSVKLITGP